MSACALLHLGAPVTALLHVVQPVGGFEHEEDEPIARLVEGRVDAGALRGAAAAEEHRDCALVDGLFGLQLRWASIQRRLPLLGLARPRRLGGRGRRGCGGRMLALRYLGLLGHYLGALPCTPSTIFVILTVVRMPAGRLMVSGVTNARPWPSSGYEAIGDAVSAQLLPRPTPWRWLAVSPRIARKPLRPGSPRNRISRMGPYLKFSQHDS